MTWRVVAACLLVSLFLSLLVFSLNPTFILVARAGNGTRVFCRLIGRGVDILYLSVNSIYKVPVQERLRVQDDGAVETVEVISTPDVVYYYGIESFTRLDNGMVSASPPAVRFRELRIKVGSKGQQYLVIGEERIPLYEFVAEGEPITLKVDETPRALACW